jgi:two-component system sensor histidine kinase NblS
MVEKLQYHEKQHINRLVLEKNKLELIASVIADGIILVDLDLRVLFVNHIARKFFNWLNFDIIGDNLTNYLPLHIIDSLLPILNNLIKLTYLDSLNYSYKEITLDIDYDSKKNYRFLLTALIDNNGKILTGIAIIIQDISREVKLNKAKNQFISNVSHELRTPLCNIGSFLETLLDYNESLNNKQKNHFLKIANDETQRLSRLVNDILDLSRLESNFKYDLSNINLIHLLKYILNTSQIIANKHNIKLILEVEPNVIYVRGHESSFIQIISNLLSNAIKFTNDYGQVIIRVYSISSLPINNFLLRNKNPITLIRIEIIDEGIGIDNIEQKIIFDRFVRIEDNIHTLQGTGLGLSIVKNILRKYDTDIFVDSDLLVGTSLWFDLFQI